MGNDYATAVQKSVVVRIRLDKAVSNRGTDAKVATFDRLTAGDCTEEAGATLIFESDGRAGWDATTFTSSTHFGDVWHSTFVVLDEFNVELFKLPTVSSPKMDDDGTKYRWQRNFKYDASVFDRMAFVDYSAAC